MDLTFWQIVNVYNRRNHMHTVKKIQWTKSVLLIGNNWEVLLPSGNGWIYLYKKGLIEIIEM